MGKLTDLSMTAALQGLAAGTFKASEVVETHIEAAIAKGRPLNAFITETFDQARAAAKESDARWANGTARPMEGLPIGMKDLYCTRGIRTTAASKILENFIPPYESTVSQKLLDAGAITIGKTNLDEFAMGSSTATSAFKPTISPWTGPDPAKAPRKLVPGGSSGGSAAAVSARVVMAATGTDTGGSIRQPSGVTGIVGIKPTYGRCSRYGIVAFASSLDQAGPMARTVADAALMLREMAGFDEKDSTSMNLPVPDYTKEIGTSVKGMKIGIPREYRIDGVPAETNAIWDKAADVLRGAGAEIIDIRLPHTKYALPTYYIIAPAEASSNLARYDGVRFGVRHDGDNLIDMYENSRGAGFGVEVRRRIFMGTYVLSAGYYDAYYLKAQKVRRCIRNDFLAAFEACDAILTPTAPGTAFAIGENEDDPIKMYLEDVFTVTLNLAGLPGLAVPVGLAGNGLPMGVQLIGKPFEEGTLFRLGAALEKEVAFDAQPPFVA